MKLHLEGKTDQAKADLARLAIIKKQREDAAKKRDELRKGEKMQKWPQNNSGRGQTNNDTRFVTF